MGQAKVPHLPRGRVAGKQRRTAARVGVGSVLGRRRAGAVRHRCVARDFNRTPGRDQKCPASRPIGCHRYSMSRIMRTWIGMLSLPARACSVCPQVIKSRPEDLSLHQCVDTSINAASARLLQASASESTVGMRVSSARTSTTGVAPTLAKPCAECMCKVSCGGDFTAVAP